MPTPPDRMPGIDAVVAGLAASGLAIVPGLVAGETLAALRDEALRREAVGGLAAAGIGRGAARVERAAIRGDRISWLDEATATAAEREFRLLLEELRVAINRELMLGLWNYEGHYAVYPPGAFYARHVDRFRDDDARLVSCILYLNDGWRSPDGGALRLHLDAGAARDVLPQGGTLVAFLSDRFPHEVLPAARRRIALTGWFRRRG